LGSIGNDYQLLAMPPDWALSPARRQVGPSRRRWPSAGDDGAALCGAAGSGCLHRLHQWTCKFFRL